MSVKTGQIENGASAPAWRKWLPLASLVVLVVLVFLTGLNRWVSFDALALNYAALTAWVAAHPLLAILGSTAFYALMTAISFPAAWLLTVAVALVFGWALAAAIVVVGATLGAGVLYWATRLALADFFRARAGDQLNRMAEGFRRDAVSYLLFLRLAPVIPFTLVNVVPAILGVPFSVFIFTTAIGIVPGTLAYAFAGEGLRSVIGERAEACAAGVPPCGEPLAASDLVTPEILIAFALLGLVSLLPVVLKRLRRGRPSGQ